MKINRLTERKEDAMPNRLLKTRALIAALGLGVLGGATHAGAADDPYPAMAPLDQYLMADRAAEIALARSAAPPAVSGGADILVLGRRGYETAVKGGNGFVCLVQRAWFAGLDDKEFWNPKVRAPICFNAQGARSVLPAFLQRTGWVLAGADRAEMEKRTRAEAAAKTIPIPEAGVITYMMSKDGYLGDGVHGPWHPHLMFFVPRMDTAEWGANLPASPVMGADGGLEPWTLFFVPVPRWSDGTLDQSPPMAHDM
jgi:hypothetical protein